MTGYVKYVLLYRDGVAREKALYTEILYRVQDTMRVKFDDQYASHAVGILLDKDLEIRLNDFRRLVSSYSSLNWDGASIGYLQRVSREERPVFERYVSEMYGEDFCITGLNATLDIVCRPEDTPVMWSLTLATPDTQRYFGFDMHLTYPLTIDDVRFTGMSQLAFKSTFEDLGGTPEFTVDGEPVYDETRDVITSLLFQPIGSYDRMIVKTLQPRGVILDIVDHFDLSNEIFVTRTMNTTTELLFDLQGLREMASVTPSLPDISEYRYVFEWDLQDSRFALYMSTCVRTPILIPVLTSIYGAAISLVIAIVYFHQTKLFKANSEMITRKSQFVAHVTHELRTPLNGILGTISVMQSMSVSGRIKSCVQDLSICGESLMSVISNILDFSKIEASQQIVKNSLFSPTHLIRDVYDVMAAGLTCPRISFELRVVDMPQKLYGDADKIRQVSINLVSNAFKFTDHGKVTINVSYPEQLRVSVEDSGIGMTKDSVKKLFSPFTQVHSDRSAGGTGLGLSISKSMCQQVGGDLSCYSEKGSGSEFVATFPCEIRFPELSCYNKISDLEPCEQRLRYDGDDIEQSLSRNMFGVLVVDDVLINRKVFCELAQHVENVICHQACDGVKALEMCRDNKYDAMFLDEHMPGMNGSDVAEEVRKIKGYETVTIVSMSGDESEEVREKLEAQGVNVRICKPISKEVLVSRLTTLRDNTNLQNTDRP